MLTGLFMRLFVSFVYLGSDRCVWGCGGLDQIMTIIPLALFFGLGRNLGWVYIFRIRVASCRVFIRCASDGLRQNGLSV